jgi:hypothetical protein
MACPTTLLIPSIHGTPYSFATLIYASRNTSGRA